MIINNHKNFRDRLSIDYQYQSINWYRLSSIVIDCHRLFRSWFLHEDVALDRHQRHQDVGWKVRLSEIVQVWLWGAWILVTLETTRKLHAVNFYKGFWDCYLGHPCFFLRFVLSDWPKFVAFSKKSNNTVQPLFF